MSILRQLLDEQLKYEEKELNNDIACLLEIIGNIDNKQDKLVYIKITRQVLAMLPQASFRNDTRDAPPRT